MFRIAALERPQRRLCLIYANLRQRLQLPAPAGQQSPAVQFFLQNELGKSCITCRQTAGNHLVFLHLKANYLPISTPTCEEGNVHCEEQIKCNCDALVQYIPLPHTHNCHNKSATKPLAKKKERRRKQQQPGDLWRASATIVNTAHSVGRDLNINSK